MSQAPRSGFVWIPGSERTELPQAEDAGPVADDEQIQVTVVTRRRAELPQEYVHGPATLSREELAARFGADPAEVERVRQVLGRYGLEVTVSDAGARQLKASGPVSAFAAAFGVSLRRVATPDPSGGSVTHRYRTGGLQLPAELDGIVTAVVGLDDRPQARPHAIATPAAGAGAAVSYTPAQVGAFYKFPAGTDGTGQVLAILEFGGGINTQADLATYFASQGVNPPAVIVVGVDGATSSPGQSADAEVMLDIEIAGALAPKAQQYVYFAPNTAQGWVDGITAAVHASPSPTVISISWSGPEDTSWSSQTLTALEQQFADACALGTTVCVDSGDWGAPDRFTDGLLHCEYPPSGRYVLGCGGTSLTGNTATGTITSETVWNDASGATGGGVSVVFPPPPFQSHVTVPAGRNGAGRGVPDVAGNADPATGYQVRYAGQNCVYGGTSAVAPLWAALICRLAQATGKRFGLINTLLYAGVTGNAPAPGFQDITNGGNNGYNAGPGWDPCTGLGSPNGTALLARLTLAPTPAVVYVADGGDGTLKIYNPATSAITASIATGSNAFEVQLNPAGTQAWVSNAGAGTVSIVDTTTRAVTGTITVGTSPAAVAFTPNGATAYVSNSGNGTISVVNTATQAVTATISVGGDPRDSAVTPDGSTLYVADHTQGVVYAISTATNAVTKTITATGSYPVGLAISRDGSAVYVANNGSANVSVIAAATGTVTATIAVGDHPTAVALTPDGTAAYVVNNNAASVSVIAVATGTVTATIPVGSGPCNVAFDPAGTTAYVTNMNDNTVSVISTATRTVTGLATGFSAPRGITTVAPTPAVVYVADGGDGTLKIYNPATSAITASIATGSNAFEVQLNPAGTQAWVSNAGAGTVSIVDTTTRAVTGTITVGTSPAAVAFTPNGATAYVSNSGNGTISVVNTATQAVTATISVGGDPRDSAVTPDGSALYVADHTQGVVYAISTATNAVTKTITATGSYPVGLAISRDGSAVYVANNGSANVSVISRRHRHGHRHHRGRRPPHRRRAHPRRDRRLRRQQQRRQRLGDRRRHRHGHRDHPGRLRAVQRGLRPRRDHRLRHQHE